MARRKPAKQPTQPADPAVRPYRHPDKRKNNPPAGLAAQGRVREAPRLQFAYNPHLPPVLRFDPTGAADRLPVLLEAARTRALTDEEARSLADALRGQEPWLEWAGKRERKGFEVEPVALHIHERVAAQAILRVAARLDVQRDLFADPQLAYREAVQFYQHDVDWANRMVLGDSLQVMASLARRESLAGKVQMIYMDPPYGIRFASNFQPEIGRRDVKDKESDLTREPEMVKAYRDTWTLGVHSYLAYLRDRLILCRELLADSGSIFVQISDENLHRLRCVMDEVFGPHNFAGLIVVQKTGGLGTSGLKAVADYLLWYARDVDEMYRKKKYRQLYRVKLPGVGEGSGARYDQLESADGLTRRVMTVAERNDPSLVPQDWRLRQLTSLTSGAFRENTTVPFTFQGESFHPGQNACWKTTVEGLTRLVGTGRIERAGRTLRYVRYLDDFPAYEITNVWDDVAGSPDKIYVVQTNAEAYLDRMLRLLRSDGVRFPNNKILRFTRLDPSPGDYLHAEGEWDAGNGQTRRVAVSFGPEHGPVTAYQVENALAQASRRGMDDLVFSGFSFDAAAQGAIQDDPNPRVRSHLAHVSPDVAMGDLLKETAGSQLFTVFGSPRTELRETDDGHGQFVVEMQGVDVYNPVENTIVPTGADKVAAWFVDSDYDGRTFCITQAFFPDRAAWDKLARALRGVIDEERFAALTGTVSLPFPAGAHRRAAVKVIDPRGNEVMRVHRLAPAGAPLAYARG